MSAHNDYEVLQRYLIVRLAMKSADTQWRCEGCRIIATDCEMTKANHTHRMIRQVVDIITVDNRKQPKVCSTCIVGAKLMSMSRVARTGEHCGES